MTQLADPNSFLEDFLRQDDTDLLIQPQEQPTKPPEQTPQPQEDQDELSVEAFMDRARQIQEAVQPSPIFGSGQQFVRGTQTSSGLLFGKIAGIVNPEFVNRFEENLRQEIGDFDPNSVAGFLGEVSGQIIPAVAATLLGRKAGPTIAATTFGLSSVGGKRAEIAKRQEAGEDISGLQEWTVAISTGLAEAIGEFAGTRALQRFGDAIGPLVKGQLSEAMKQSSETTFGAIIKNLLSAAGINATEEIATTVMQNSAEKMIIDRDQPLLQGVGRSALAGGVGGILGAGAIGTATAVTGQPTIQEITRDDTQDPIRQIRSQEQIGQEPVEAGIQEGSPETPEAGGVLQEEGQVTQKGIEAQRPPRQEPAATGITDQDVETLTRIGIDKSDIARKQREQEARRRNIKQSKIKPIPPEQEASEPDGLPPLPERPARLRGKRQAGDAPMVRELGEEIGLTLQRHAESLTEAPALTANLIRVATQRTREFAASQGPAGQEFANRNDVVDLKASQQLKNAEVDIRDTLSGAGRVTRKKIMMAVNGRLENPSPAIQARADRIREILDRMLGSARELGFVRTLTDGTKIPVGGVGKAFPQMPNAKGRKFLNEVNQKGTSSHRVYRVASEMVDRGQATDINDALAQLEEFRKNILRGVSPYLERTRVELPDDMIEWDPDAVLPGVMTKNWLLIEAAREYGGPDLPELDALFARMRTETESATVTMIDRSIKHQLGVGGEVQTGLARFFQGASNYQTAMRLGGSLLSAMRNSFQRYTNSLDYPLADVIQATREFPPFINRWIASSRKLKTDLERTGVVRSTSELGNVETGVIGERATQTALKMFSSVETGNQVFAAILAKKAVERDIKRIIKIQGQDGAVGRLMEMALIPASQRRLGRLGIDNAQLAQIIADGGRLTPDQLQEAMNRSVLDTQFALTLATKPVWWSTHPFWRLAAKFKTFGIRQTELIYNVAFRELFKGNPAPMGRFIMFTLIAGELYNIIRDMLQGKEESLTNEMLSNPDKRNARDLSWRLINDFTDGGGIGFMADLVFGLGNFITGPVGSTYENGADLAMDVKQRPKQLIAAVRRFISREASITRQLEVLNRLDRKILNDQNRVIDYKIVRARAFEFKEEEKDPSRISRGIERFIEGFPDHGRGQNTLIYEFAARQISVGDVQDAADYLTDILNDAETPRERQDLIKGVKISRNAKSPLGPIAQRDRARFLSQFSEKERKRILELQRLWMSNYNKAIKKAIEQSK